MSSLVIASIALGSTLAGLLVGILLRAFLPEHHVRDESKDIMKTAAGMMATLVALVVGLLVSSAKSSFDATSAGLTQGGAKIISLDRILARYGPAAAPIRETLRRAVGTGISRIWPEDGVSSANLGAVENATGMEDVFDAVRDLAPQNESQQYLKGQALQLSADLMQTRWLLIEQSQNVVPTTFLIALTSWLTVLFAGFGLLSPRNPTAISALVISAASMAGAIYLILELNRPLEGHIKVSSAPLVKALSVIGK